MEKTMMGKSHNRFWSVLLAFLLFFSFSALFFHYSGLSHGGMSINLSTVPSLTRIRNGVDIDTVWRRSGVGDIVGHFYPRPDDCTGKYIYVHDLPSRFNDDILKNCTAINPWYNICEYLTNSGLGPQLSNWAHDASGSWFATDQFLLEVIFRNRMKQYRCLTNDSASAAAVYVPFYGGLEVSRHLWGFNSSIRDAVSNDLIQFLVEQPQWKHMSGKDHFLVVGRITWDFRRVPDNESFWGSNFLRLPATKNITVLGIESNPAEENDFAIPYPTYFHPSHDSEAFEWQDRMRKHKRRYLFSFAGGPRPELVDSIRGEIIKQCQASRKKCKFLDCVSGSDTCKMANVMETFQNSSFCLQPPGDSFTRRSTFDSILAGCIPVFFHPASAYKQYLWHLPKNHAKYSVFIPANDIKDGKVSIKKVLLGISEEKQTAMREEVLGLIPKVVYANPNSSLETMEDAFDIAVREVLERVKELRRSESSASG